MKKELLDSIIYQVHVRNFTEEGTFSAVIDRLDYIKKQGTDILYLMPIHPIGIKGRKGTVGSPYSIRDYLAIDEDYGTIDDFKRLINETHKREMKIMMDIVYNHTARDSVLLDTHPDFYYRDNEGNIGNKVGEWSDVADLRTDKDEVQDYLIDVLEYYVNLGVDGFRFDVASLLPSSFYKKARMRLGDDVIFLGEAIDSFFVIFSRSMKIDALSNEELFTAGCDCLYHYASWKYLDGFLNDPNPETLYRYCVALNMEQASIREDGLIVRAIENHDRPRICSYNEDDLFHRSLLAFSMFTRGPAFVFMGEEYGEGHLPNLFEKDPIIHKENKPYHDFYLTCVESKKRNKNLNLLTTNAIEGTGMVLVIENTYENNHKEVGLFPFRKEEVKLDIKDGGYKNILSGGIVKIEKGTLFVDAPMIIELD